LTTREALLRGISLGLQHGRLKVANAKTMLSVVEQPEPSDRSRLLLLGDGLTPGFMRGSDGGKKLKSPYWVPNVMSNDDEAWLVIHGIEDGWFERKSGYLRLTQMAVQARGLSLET
jgi:hypothetical protein